MGYKALNNASSLLASGIEAADTVINVATGKGLLFAVGLSDYTYATLQDTAGHIEVVKITAQSGDALTVVRSQDGTTSRAWLAGDVIECRPCAAAYSALSYSAQVADAANKVTIIDNDRVALIDSADAGKIKYSLWSQIKAVLKSYFDTLYQAASTAINTGNISSQSVNYAATSGSASSAAVVPWSGVSGKPTTAAGFGISDAITTGNIGAQSVNYSYYTGYATSAGNADTLDGEHKTTFISWYWYWTAALASNTTYTITLPTVASNGLLMVTPYMECIIADGGYEVGDHVLFSELVDNTSRPTFDWKRAANQAVFKTATSGVLPSFQSNISAPGSPYQITNLNKWRFKIVVISSIP